MIKEYLEIEKEKLVRIYNPVHTNSIKYLNELMKELLNDFPDIQENEIQIVLLIDNEKFNNSFCFDRVMAIQFVSNKEHISDDYKRKQDVDFLATYN